MKKLLKQVLKFGIVGIIAFAIDYFLLIFLTEVFQINYLISATISFTASVIFNYFASMRFVFEGKDGVSKKKEFTIFVCLSIVGLLLNDLLMWIGVSLLGVDYRIFKIVVTLIVSLWNFVSRKIFLEKKPSE